VKIKVWAYLDFLQENARPYEQIMPMFFKSYYAGITEDFNPASPTNKINMLNSDTNNADYRNFPKVAFYAVEPQENIFWRTLNWMALKEPNDSPPFEANDDWGLYNSVNNMVNTYQGRADYYLATYQFFVYKYNNLAWLEKILVGSIHAANRDNAYNSYIAWIEGLTWLCKASESWQTIIGARELVTKPNPNYNPFLPLSLRNNPPYIYEWVVKEANDGIVLAESASNLPKATHAPIEIYPNKNNPVDIDKGSSHMQVRNDEGIKKALKDLFDGNYDKWFYTATK
jgi:hypothetical protein